MSERWSIILHGGAKDIPADQEEAHRIGLGKALAIGRQVLAAGGTALDAVERTVRQLEEDPIFNAGLGSVRNTRGEMLLDASIMDGATLDIGAVAGLEGYLHPVSIARHLLREKPVLLAGHGAHDFARDLDAELMPQVQPHLEVTSGAAIGGDTVGCVAMDMAGNFAVATSTGGLEGTKPGRVGDVPMAGCGFYADDTRGAPSLSGDGEAIARLMLAGETLRLMDERSPGDAITAALENLQRVKGEAGIIAIGRDGRSDWNHNSSHFAVARADHSNPQGEIALRRKEVAGG
jgi:beta-aspartyl-peptidase (threonine type)